MDFLESPVIFRENSGFSARDLEERARSQHISCFAVSLLFL
jgi:hypothetical protein